ncbi:hypothetical protein CRENPOLYSF1_1630003 [Crenothrix polyspora]|uniref:Uncharacterized protein n=1 Tax=Crenothrix polyspora TaxID=360316 RepID=A0A1R4H3Q2_9GAMM|nr:hypothetical protein CRENPOLYSF1_1630003 [Crenothrix polyspora]
MAEKAGVVEHQRPLVQSARLCLSVNASQFVEPPTADPHGGWCGGWGLDAPGYPISEPNYTAKLSQN